MIEVKKNIEDELRGALLEAKESIEGKRKLNTLDNLIRDARGLAPAISSPHHITFDKE